jgi:lambda family phage portal protein
MQTTWLIQKDPTASPLIANANGQQDAIIAQEPAATNVLPAGWEPMSVQPGIPQSTYAEFHRLAGHTIAVGLGTHYAQLVGDARDANSSSQRVMAIRERRMWRADQEVLRRTLHEPLFAMWLEQAVLTGAVRLRGAPLSSVVAEWLPTKWDWTDPMKDVNSAALEIALGINSRTNVAADKGRDFGTVLAQLAEEQRAAKDAGVTLYTPTTVALPVQDASDRDDTTTSDARARLAMVRAAGA